MQTTSFQSAINHKLELLACLSHHIHLVAMHLLNDTSLNQQRSMKRHTASIPRKVGDREEQKITVNTF